VRVGVLGLFPIVLAGVAVGQNTAPPVFDVASVRVSERLAGPDENNRIVFEPAGFTGRNVTLRRCLAEAYRLQLSQVVGPAWLDRSEYDIDAKASGPAGKDQLALMLRTLLAERFKLVQHTETKELRVYELVVDKGGPRIRAVDEGGVPGVGGGFHFHGDLHRFADLLAVQLSIAGSDDPTRPGRASGPPVPVLDKTGLAGVYDFAVDIRPEPGSDIFALWQRTLQEKMGLRLESRRASVKALVVDNAEKIPTAN
jgi:uncharacterized protein (TIGR03435 family)